MVERNLKVEALLGVNTEVGLSLEESKDDGKRALFSIL